MAKVHFLSVVQQESSMNRFQNEAEFLKMRKSNLPFSVILFVLIGVRKYQLIFIIVLKIFDDLFSLANQLTEEYNIYNNISRCKLLFVVYTQIFAYENVIKVKFKL